MMAAAISGGMLDTGMLSALVLSLGLLTFVLLRSHPRTSVAVSLAAIAFVPIWHGIPLPINGNVSAPLSASIVALTIVTLLPVARFRFSLLDLVPLLLILVSVSSLVTGDRDIAMSFLFTLFFYYLSGYLLGRLAPARVSLEWVYGAVAVVFTAVAALVVLEFATGWNPFISVPVANSLFAEWGTLQERGGILRAEGAFGHSIALGCSLAMAIPLTLASPLRLAARLPMVAVLLAGSTLSFSRSAILCAVLALVFSIVFLPGRDGARARIAMAVSATVAAAAAVPLLGGVFAEAGAEASGSAEYRGDLIGLLDHSEVIGFSDLTVRAPDGTLYFGDFESIDSQLILTAVSNGLLTLGAVAAALAIAIALMLTRRATAPTIAIVAQIPALATAALITQYAIFLWFVVGLAASSQLTRQERPSAASRSTHAREPVLVRLPR